MSYLITQDVVVPSEFIGAFIGKDGKNIRHSAMQFEVEIVITSHRHDPFGCIRVTGEPDGVMMAVSEINQYSHGDVKAYLEMKQRLRWIKLAVIVDWSNVRLGSGRRRHIHVPALCNRIFSHREPEAIIVASAVPTRAVQLSLTQQWLYSTVNMPNCFSCTPTVDIQLTPDGKEHNIDDRLIAAAFHQISGNLRVPRKLVLVTGDGNKNGGPGWVSVNVNFFICHLFLYTSNLLALHAHAHMQGSFIQLVETALAMGVEVEVWAWRNAISGKYEELKRTNHGKFEIKYLDDYEEEICTQCRFFSATGKCPSGSDCEYGHYVNWTR